MAALLLSASVVFAESKAPGTSGENERGTPRMIGVASTTVGGAIKNRMEKEREKEREKVTEHLSNIQDKQKQKTAEQIAGQFDNLNQTWTDHFTKQLDQYSAVLAKIQSRADIAKGAGKDISSTTAAIQTAQVAITNARAAVAAQAAKTYTIASSTLPTTATSTSSGQEKFMQGLRKSFQSLHTTLFKDLNALSNGPMKTVRKAVQNALQTLGKVRGVDDDHDGRATSTQSN
jgi:hypothetical protein